MQTAVVGAGLVGRLLAWQLAEAGAQVRLLDCAPKVWTEADKKSHPKPIGLVAAAMIAPSTEAVTSEPLVKTLGEASLELWPRWTQRLQAQTGLPVPFARRGTLVIAHQQDQADWQRFMHQSDAMLGEAAAQRLGAEALAKLEPELVPHFERAAYFAEEGAVVNTALYTALEARMAALGVDWNDQYEADAVLGSDGQLAGHDTAFERVFDCRGLGGRAAWQALAQSDAALSEKHLSLRGVRGEVLRVYAPEVSLSRPVRLMHPRYPLYIAPHSDHEYVIGATQIESDDMAPVTVRSGLELLSALYSVHKGFAEARILSLDVGLRPAFADNLPRVSWCERLVSINGLYRHGFLFAPALVNDVLAGVNDEAMRFPEVLVH